MGQSKLILFFLRLGSIYGSTWFYLLLILASFFFGVKWSIFLSSALILSISITAIIRFFYFKDRPNPKNYTSLLSRIRASSFPSAHVQRPIFLLFFFQTISTYFLLLGFLGLVLVVFQRYRQKFHDWFDISGGIFLGLLFGIFIKTLVF